MGLTILELMIVVAMMGILTATVGSVYNLQYKSWNKSYIRSSIRGDLSQALERAIVALRQAQSIDDLTESSVTFTADFGGGSSSYRLYLFHEDDDEPNPPYEQDSYSLRFAQGSVDYGEGAVLCSDIAQPENPVFAMDGNLLTIDLTVSRESQQAHMRTSVRPRNL